jgi:hypothetical protein
MDIYVPDFIYKVAPWVMVLGGSAVLIIATGPAGVALGLGSVITGISIAFKRLN